MPNLVDVFFIWGRSVSGSDAASMKYSAGGLVITNSVATLIYISSLGNGYSSEIAALQSLVYALELYMMGLSEKPARIWSNMCLYFQNSFA